MTNKDKLKRAIEDDINSKKCYNEIIKKIEKEDKKKKNISFKWSLVPTCLIVVISGVLFLNYQYDNRVELKNRRIIDRNVILNINEINSNSKVGTHRLDLDVKTVTDNSLNFPIPYDGELSVPEDLNSTYHYIYYGKKDKESKEYDVLVNYKIGYCNDNGREIQIAYSIDHKPARDYYFDDEGNSKTTIINGVELKIYKIDSSYFVEFQFNEYNFDIETFKITEQELSDLLLSILK